MVGRRTIGKIVRLQIQSESLKRPLAPRPGEGHTPERYYDPSPIVPASRLWVTDSVAAVPLDGHYVLDVHAAAHPDTRNRGNGNMLSIGLSAHYENMRFQFGDHLIDGIAGENILVESGDKLTVDDFRGDVSIELQTGGCVRFDHVTIAAPCVEFSRFCLNDRFADPLPTSQALRFLDNGTRGFYGYMSSGLPAMIQIGDHLCVTTN